MLSPDAIDRLLSGIRARLSIMVGAEITLEANPGTIDNARFQGFREAGINRLSLGIQSFSESALQHLGRIHGSIEAINAIFAAHKAGFNTINLDLMFGLPAQTIETALEGSWYTKFLKNQPFFEFFYACFMSRVNYYKLLINN